ncbi:hypothetical protein C8Q74DRAFT_1299662 [Fomes fomentarius]|nr:hypothetical protein C8Q74DRAFT_1299662 [Fomes fomentarius]
MARTTTYVLFLPSAHVFFSLRILPAHGTVADRSLCDSPLSIKTRAVDLLRIARPLPVSLLPRHVSRILKAGDMKDTGRGELRAVESKTSNEYW